MHRPARHRRLERSTARCSTGSCLDRSALTAERAVEHLVGMQAQSPLAPYVGLWTRLRNFDTDDLASLLIARRAVRGTSIRKTLHLHTTTDYLSIRPLIQGALEGEVRRNTTFGKDLVEGLAVEAVAAAGRRAVEEQPRTGVQLREFLGRLWPERDPFALWHVAVCLLPLVQVPPRGLWGRTGPVALTTVEAWLGRGLDTAPEPGAAVLRYLAAFGPASTADIRTWSGLTGIRELIEPLRGQLRTFTDGRGRELFDVPEGRHPGPDAVAAPRFCPSSTPSCCPTTTGHASCQNVISVGSTAVWGGRSCWSTASWPGPGS